MIVTGKQLISGDVIIREIQGNLIIVNKSNSLCKVKCLDGTFDHIHYQNDETLLVVDRKK